MKKHTKSYIVWTILLLVVITYFMFARDFHSLNGKLLERDKDTEFEKGSGIRTKKLSDGRYNLYTNYVKSGDIQNIIIRM